MNRTWSAFAVSALALALAGPPAAAQGERSITDRFGQMFGRGAPPADMDDDDRPPPPRMETGASVRIDRLENQVRSLTGQIEQMQYAMRKLEEQVRKYQQDIEFRLQEQSRPAKRAEDGAPPIVAQTTPPAPATTGTTPSTGLRRGDAFDPAAAPNAPGAPRQIGTAPATDAPRAPAATPRIVGEAGAPMDLSGGRLAANGGVVEPSRGGGAIVGTPIIGAPLPAAGATPSAPSPGGSAVASAEPFSPKDEYEQATGFLKNGQYEAAEKSYSTFLSKNPKNRLVPEAVFNLGETYFQRGRHREAAEQYLKISTTYSTVPRAPEAMLRLGQSLEKLGAKEQACASFGEIPRKYPNASPTVRAAAEREAKRSQC